MKLTASGGTDGATIVLFWPDQLPEDGEERLQNDPMALFEDLAAEGKLVRFPCNADGSYTLTVYVNEGISAEKLARYEQVATMPRLIARGDGYFGGGECVYKDARQFLDKYPHMTGRIGIPPGVYRAAVYAAREDSDFSDQWIREHVEAQDLKVHRLVGCFIGCVILSVLVGFVSIFVASWPVIAARLGLRLVLCWSLFA